MRNSLVVVLLIVAKINILYLYDIYLNYTQNINPVIYIFFPSSEMTIGIKKR